MSSTATAAPTTSEQPWTIEGQFDDEVAVTVMSANGFDICEVYPLTGQWSPEDIANAHAIKAAPQLLKCLKEALVSLGGETAPEEGEDGEDGDPLWEWRQAVACAEAGAVLIRDAMVARAVKCECGAALVNVSGAGVTAVVCPVCDADSSALDEEPA